MLLSIFIYDFSVSTNSIGGVILLYKMVPLVLKMVLFLFRGQHQMTLPRKTGSNSANFKMADCVEGLRNLVLGEIESISRILVGPSQMFDVQEPLE